MKALEVLLGYGCNEKCLFCSQETSWRRLPGLPFDLVARQLYLAAHDGYRSVCFTGGEPTLRPDLAKMAAYAKKLGFEYIRVQTNGVRLADPEFAASLIDAGVSFFRVSVHGHTPELHDGLVLVPGALDKVRAAVENVRSPWRSYAPGTARKEYVLSRGQAGFGINIVLNARNYKQLAEMCDRFLDWGWSDFVIIYPLYEGDMARNEQEMRVSLPDVAPFVRDAFRVFENRKAPSPRLLNFTPCAVPELARHMLSWSAHSALVVDSRGRPVDLYMAAHDDRAYGENCAACAYKPSCLGFKKSYLQRFPAEDLAPVHGASVLPPENHQEEEHILGAGEGLFDEGRFEIARAIQPLPEQPKDANGALWVEQMKIHLDSRSLKLDEERAKWAVAKA